MLGVDGSKIAVPHISETKECQWIPDGQPVGAMPCIARFWSGTSVVRSRQLDLCLFLVDVFTLLKAKSQAVPLFSSPCFERLRDYVIMNVRSRRDHRYIW